MEETMFIDPQRCIGCRACVAACRECATHKGYSMIYVDYLDRAQTTATMPTVCMHCVEPTCALVCPADAIKDPRKGQSEKSQDTFEGGSAGHVYDLQGAGCSVQSAIR